MLSKILKKSTCADCKFCCVFCRASLWEVPNFPATKKDELQEFAVRPPIFTREGEALALHLESFYKTTSSDEVVPCNFLDEKCGCTLPDNLKPLQCKIWPFRIVKRNGKHLLIFETTCPALGKELTKDLHEFAETLVTPVKNYLASHPEVAFLDETGVTDKFPVVRPLDD